MKKLVSLFLALIMVLSLVSFASAEDEVKITVFHYNLPNIQLELIEPNEARSTWRDFLEKHGEGIHHYGYQVADIRQSMADMKAAGYQLTQFGYYGDASGAYAYYDCTAELGCFVELLCSFR